MKPHEVVSAFFTAVERKRLDEAWGLLADDLKVVGPAPVPLGKKEFTAMQTAVSVACPDWRFNCSSLETDGERVTATCRITATHTGELNLPIPGVPQHVAPTGRHAQFPEEKPRMTVRNGKIAAIDFDTVPGGGVPGLLKQFGVTP